MASAARRDGPNDDQPDEARAGDSAADSMTDREAAAPRQLVIHKSSFGDGIFDQVARAFYRLTWRTPIHGFRLEGRHPLRLLAAPADPLPGDKTAGMAIRAGHFRFRGAKIPLSALSAAKPALPADALAYLHRFDWLRDLDAAAGVDGARVLAEPLVAAWLARHDRAVGEPVWRADIAAWRMMTMMAHAPAILASRDLVYRSKVLNDLARTARHLDRSAARTRPGAPRILAWAGVVGAGLLLPDGQARRLVGEDALDAAIAGAVHDDGGIVSRSPMVLADVIAMLSLLASAYAARREAPPPFLGAAAARMVAALTGLAHGDGGLSAWQGAPMLGPERLAALVAASGARVRPLKQSRDWGYQRLTGGKAVVIMDCAPPPLADQCAAGCASTLAFELSHGPTRIVINCGGGAMLGAHIDAALARGLRSTAAHSSLVVADTNSTAILAGGRLGQGVNGVDMDRQDVAGQDAQSGQRVEAAHDGYLKSFGLAHRRSLTLSANGSELRGDDVLIPAASGRRRGALPLALRFHLGPDVEPILTGPGGMLPARTAVLALPDGSMWDFRVTAGRLVVEDSLWVGDDSVPRPTRQLALHSQTEPGGTSISWAFTRQQ